MDKKLIYDNFCHCWLINSAVNWVIDWNDERRLFISCRKDCSKIVFVCILLLFCHLQPELFSPVFLYEFLSLTKNYSHINSLIFSSLPLTYGLLYHTLGSHFLCFGLILNKFVCVCATTLRWTECGQIYVLEYINMLTYTPWKTELFISPWDD